MKAAGGHIRVQGIRGSVSKMMSKKGKNSGHDNKNGDENQEHHWGKEKRG